MDTDTGRTRSVWMETVDTLSYPRLERNARTDVCVVGAGIAGITTAYLLARAGRHVMVLDDGPVGGGETGRTTAHLANAMDDRLYRLRKLHGEEGARLAAQSHGKAIDLIAELVDREGIDCDFTWLDGYLFLAPEHDRDELERELEAAHAAGLAGVELLPRAPVEFWSTGPCLRFPDQGQFHPLRYVHGLARAIERERGRLHCGTHVKQIDGEGPLKVSTSGGHTVTAEHVVVATNSPISDYVVTHVKQAPYRTFAIGARVPAGSVPRALFWDTGDPYHYIRTHRLDDEHDVLIVGGEDHKTGQKDDASERFAHLDAWMRQRFPMVRDVPFLWSGQVMEPADYLGLIGRNPGSEQKLWIATGDSGQGMTHGTIAGIVLSDLITGRENAWSTLYDPERTTLRAAPEYAKENINVAVQYADWVKPSEVSSVEDIPPESGAVIRRGRHRVAVYRDERGQLHERSASCTHLRCVVHWNSAEGSWDCPCHGSRFDPYGAVLNGPALSPLEEAPEE